MDDQGPPPDPVLEVPPPKDIKILETAEDIQVCWACLYVGKGWDQRRKNANWVYYPFRKFLRIGSIKNANFRGFSI